MSRKAALKWQMDNLNTFHGCRRTGLPQKPHFQPGFYETYRGSGFRSTLETIGFPIHQGMGSDCFNTVSVAGVIATGNSTGRPSFSRARVATDSLNEHPRFALLQVFPGPSQRLWRVLMMPLAFITIFQRLTAAVSPIRPKIWRRQQICF